MFRMARSLLLLAGLLAGALLAAPGDVVSRQEVQEGYIEVTGGRVWYRIVGVGKPGVPLLALHGGPGGTSSGFDAFEPLADERPVIVYDQLGCGLSDRPAGTAEYTLGRFVAEIAQVRQALGLARVHLYGASWGTMIAVDYMLTRPEGIVSLTLAGPCLSASRWVADQRKYLAEMPGDALAIVTRHEAAGTFDDPEYRRVEKDFLRRHVYRGGDRPRRILRGQHGNESYLHMWGPSEFTATGTLKDYERLDLLSAITAPTLFICGQYDEATPETTALYQSRVPGARMRVIPDASHAAAAEQPELYRQVLREFLHSVEAAPSRP
jgi:proline iminopeptidase